MTETVAPVGDDRSVIRKSACSATRGTGAYAEHLAG